MTIIADLVAMIRGDSTQLKATLNDAKTDMTSFAGIASGAMKLISFAVVVEGLRMVSQEVAKTIAQYQDYVKVVHDLSRASGQSTEDASRAIQVADDLRITQEQLTSALGIAAKKGIDVSIQGLQKLADEYNSLANAQQKAAFLGDTFGKSGLVMGEMMAQGSKGIKEMSDAVEKGLIVTKEADAASLRLAQQQDRLDDSFHAVVNTIVKDAIPALTAYMEATMMSRDEQIAAQKAYGTQWVMKAYQHSVDMQNGQDQMTLLRDITDGIINEGIARKVAATSALSESNAYYVQRMKAAQLVGVQQELNTLTGQYDDALKNVITAQDNLKQSQQTYLTGVGDKVVGNLSSWATSLGYNDAALGVLDKDLGTHYLATSKQDRAIADLTRKYQWGQITLEQFDTGVQSLAKDMPTASAELLDATAKAVELRDSILALAGNWGIHVSVDWSNGTLPPLPGSVPHLPGWTPTSQAHIAGGSFVIPPGYSENFQLGAGHTASSGERVTVSPIGQDSGAVNHFYAPINIYPKSGDGLADVLRGLSQ
jgi:hypothetical protein